MMIPLEFLTKPDKLKQSGFMHAHGLSIFLQICLIY